MKDGENMKSTKSKRSKYMFCCPFKNKEYCDFIRRTRSQTKGYSFYARYILDLCLYFDPIEDRTIENKTKIFKASNTRTIETRISRTLNNLSLYIRKYSIKNFRRPLYPETIKNSKKILPFKIPNVAYGVEHFKYIDTNITFYQFTQLSEEFLCECGNCWIDFYCDD
jgi:hypothetical protein